MDQMVDQTANRERRVLKKTRIVTPSNHMVSVVARMTNSESANGTSFIHTAVEKVL